MQDRTADWEVPGRRLERVDAQLLAHIVVHAHGKDLAVEAVHDRRDVELAVGALDLRDVGQQLLPRPIRAEILMEQIFRRHRQRIWFCQSLRTTSALMQPSMLAYQARQTPQPAEDPALRQRQLHSASAVVVIVGAFVQYFLYFARKKLIPARLVLAFEIAVIARFTDLQWVAQRRDRPFAGMFFHECV